MHATPMLRALRLREKTADSINCRKSSTKCKRSSLRIEVADADLMTMITEEEGGIMESTEKRMIMDQIVMTRKTRLEIESF